MSLLSLQKICRNHWICSWSLRWNIILLQITIIFSLQGIPKSTSGGDTVLQIFTLRAGLAEPRNITSISMTKYLATTCQLRNMLNNEFDWLARHMGYDILVHRNYYRLQQDAVELAKISKVLLLIEKGETHKVAGRSLDERDINGKFIQYYFHIFSYTLVKFTKHHEK